MNFVNVFLKFLIIQCFKVGKSNQDDHAYIIKLAIGFVLMFLGR